jgi:hypothetical protein
VRRAVRETDQMTPNVALGTHHRIELSLRSVIDVLQPELLGLNTPIGGIMLRMLRSLR